MNEYVISLNAPYDKEGIIKELEAENSNLPYFPNRKIKLGTKWNSNRLINAFLTKKEVSSLKKNKQIRAIEIFTLPEYSTYQLGAQTIYKQVPLCWIHTSYPTVGTNPANRPGYYRTVIDQQTTYHKANNYENKDNFNSSYVRYRTPVLPFQLHWHYQPALTASDGKDILVNYPQHVLSGSDFPKYDIIQDLDGANVDYIHLGEKFATTFPDFFDKDGKPRVTVPNNNWNEFNGILENDSVHTQYLRNMLPEAVSSYEDSNIAHGTACRSVAAGTIFGFAKGANIIPSLDGEDNVLLSGPQTNTYDLDEVLAFHRNKPTNPTTGRKNPTVVSRSSMNVSEFDYIMIDGEKASTITVDADKIQDKAFRLTVLGRDFTFISSSTTQSAEHYLVNSQSIHHLFKYTGSLQGLETYINKHLAYNSTAWQSSLFSSGHFLSLDELYETTNTSSEYHIQISSSSPSYTLSDFLPSSLSDPIRTHLFINSTCTGSNYIIGFSGSKDGVEGLHYYNQYRAKIPYEFIKIDITNTSTLHELVGQITESINTKVAGVSAINLENISDGVSRFTLIGPGRINLKKGNSTLNPLKTLNDFYSSANNFLNNTPTTSSISFGKGNNFLISATRSIDSHETYFSASYNSNENTFTFKLWGEQYNPFRIYTGSLDQIVGKDFPRGGYLCATGSGQHARTILNSLNPYGTPLSDFKKGDLLTVKGGWFRFHHFDHFGFRSFDNTQKFVEHRSTATKPADISSPLLINIVKSGSIQFPQNVAPFLNIPNPRSIGIGRHSDFLPYSDFDNNTRPFYIYEGRFTLSRFDRFANTIAYNTLCEEAADEGILIALSHGNQNLLPPESKQYITNNSHKYVSDFFPETSSFGNTSYVEFLNDTSIGGTLGNSLNDLSLSSANIAPLYNPYNPSTNSIETGSWYYGLSRNRTPAVINAQQFIFDINPSGRYTFNEDEELILGTKWTNTPSWLANHGNFGPGNVIGMFGRMLYNSSHNRSDDNLQSLDADFRITSSPTSNYYLKKIDIGSLYNSYQNYTQNVLNSRAFYGINTSSLKSSFDNIIAFSKETYGISGVQTAWRPELYDDLVTQFQVPKSGSVFKLKKSGGDYQISTFGGVSSANPQLAGIMCLAKQKYPDLTIKEFKDLLFTKWSKPTITDYTSEFTHEDGTYNFLFLRRFNLEHNASTHSIEFSNTSNYRSLFIPTSSDNNTSITESNKILNINYDFIDAQNHAIIFSGSTEEDYVDPSSYIPSNYNIVKTKLTSESYYNNTSGLNLVPTLSRHELSLDFLNDNFNTGFLSPSSLNSENTVITIYESSSSPSEYHWIFMNTWSGFNNASSSAASQGINIVTHSFTFSSPNFATDSQRQDIWRGFIYDKLNEISIVSASATLGTVATHNASSVVTGDTISITATGSANNLVVKFNNNTNDFVDSFYINEFISAGNFLQLSGSITTQITSSSPNYSLNLYAALTGALDQLPYVTYSYENNSGYPHYIPTDLKIHPYSSNGDDGNLNVSFGLINGETSSYQNNTITLIKSGFLKGQLIDEFKTRRGQVTYGGTTSSVYIPIDNPSSLQISGDVNIGSNISIKSATNFSL